MGTVLLQWGTNSFPASGFHSKEDVCFGLNWHLFLCFSKDSKKNPLEFHHERGVLIIKTPRTSYLCNIIVVTTIKDVIKGLVCFISSPRWALRRPCSSLWGKLDRERRLTPRRQERRAVTSHRFLLTDSLTSLYGVCEGSASETEALPAWRARRRSASRSAAFCLRPDVIMPPTHPIMRSRAARVVASKQRRDHGGRVHSGRKPCSVQHTFWFGQEVTEAVQSERGWIIWACLRRKNQKKAKQAKLDTNSVSTQVTLPYARSLVEFIGWKIIDYHFPELKLSKISKIIVFI